MTRDTLRPIRRLTADAPRRVPWCALVPFFGCLFGATSHAGPINEALEALLVGDWACEAGDCPDEALSFTIDAGARVYQSWLHERPAAVDGRWRIDERRLTIVCCAGLRYEYVVTGITRDELRLRAVGADDEAVLSRLRAQD